MPGLGPGVGLESDSTTLFSKNLPAEGVETSRKILIIRSLSYLQKLLSQCSEFFHPLFVHYCSLRVRLKMRSAE